MKREIRTSGGPASAGAYSQGIVAGGFVFTAGFGPSGPNTPSVGATVAEQTAQTLRNVSAVLDAAGLTLDDVVKATVHLQNLHRDFTEFDEAYLAFFRPPYPARTTVGSDLRGILVEIDVVAKVPNGERPPR